MIQKLIKSLPNKTPEQRLAMRRNAEAWAEGDDPKKQAQGREFLAALNAFEEKLVEDDHSRLLNMSEVDRIVEAFRREQPTETEVKMIQTLANPDVGDQTLTLANAMGWDQLKFVGSSWNLHFGSMCRKREAFLNPASSLETGEPTQRRDERYYSALIADITSDGGAVRYELKPTAVEAFIRLGLLGSRARDTATIREKRRAEHNASWLELMEKVRSGAFSAERESHR